jgi:hypothetical protein
MIVHGLKFFFVIRRMTFIPSCNWTIDSDFDFCDILFTEIVVWLLTSNLIAPNRNGGYGLRFHLCAGETRAAQRVTGCPAHIQSLLKILYPHLYQIPFPIHR